MTDERVRPESQRLTDEDARKYLARGILSALQHTELNRIALTAGCDVKRIAEARDAKATLKLACVMNLLDADIHALDTLLGAKGFMLVPLLGGAPDIVESAGATLHRIGQARCPRSEGGRTETDGELISMEAEADAMLASALELRSRIVAAKVRRAA